MVENKEDLAEQLSELLLLTFNSYSKYPLTYHFINEETNEVELKKTVSGEALKEKIKKEVLNLQENG